MDSTLSETISNGATVWLAESPIHTQTDSDGSWTLNNVPIGSYEVLATKPGYGTMKWFQEQVTGPGTLYIDPIYLYSTPDCSLFLDSVTRFVDSEATNENQVNFFGRIKGLEQIIYLEADVDSDSTAQPGDPHLLQTNASDGSEIQDEGPWHFSLSQSVFSALAPGTKVFLSVYAYDDNSYTIYDPSSGQTLPVSPSKKSNSIPFTIP
jgi:outer membrane lipoprotein-sorting protein